MSAISSLSAADQGYLSQTNEAFSKRVKIITASSVTASFLIILSAIVITCSCLCLGLSDINIMKSVILPGVLPGSAGLILSIPFIIASVIKSRENKTLRKQQLEKIKNYLSPAALQTMTQEEKVAHIKQFLPKNSHLFFRQKFLDEMKDLVPKKNRTPEEEGFVKAIDKTKESLYPKKKKSS